MKSNLRFLVYVASVLIVAMLGCQSSGSKGELTSSRPLVLKGQHDKVIEGLDIKGDTSDCVFIDSSTNIILKNCRFTISKKNGVTIAHSRNITVINCYMQEVSSGVYAVQSSGVNVSNNRIKNVKGPFPRGQLVQFDEVTGAGNVISNNRGLNEPGKSDPQDAINVYKSHGTANSPIRVTGNLILGGGPSQFGGGIMLGDNGGAYIAAENNILVDPGQYGMAIAGGTNIHILNNTVYGRAQKFTNVGIYVWNQHQSNCGMNEVRGNRVNFKHAKGNLNSSWNQGNCGPVNGWDDNQWNAAITPAVLRPNFFNENIR